MKYDTDGFSHILFIRVYNNDYAVNFIRFVSNIINKTGAAFILSSTKDGQLYFSPSHLLTTAVATALPITLVAERPMSRSQSIASINARPSCGILK
jgi:hypothetical protein